MVDYIRVCFALLVVCIFSPGSNRLNSGGGECNMFLVFVIGNL